MELASEKGASSWLTALPLTEFGFSLHKGAFRDAVALRYGWLPPQSPRLYDCGSNFSIDHCLSCPKGGFPSLKNSEVRDHTARLLTEIYHDVRVEPHHRRDSFQFHCKHARRCAPIDIAASGLWRGRFQRTFVDVRVFNPHAASNRGGQLSACFRKHENTKKRAYERRIREVVHVSFTPLVFSASGGMAREATSFYKRLASLLAAKRGQTYSCTITWLRCLLSFSLLRSAIQCIRGARSSKGQPVGNPIPCDVIMRDALVSESP